MKPIRIFLTVALVSLLSTYTGAQNLLNKLKNKAQQEVNSEINKLGKGNSPSPNKNKLSSNVTRTVAASLSANEVFDYGENCIDLGASINQVSFIVSQRSGNSFKCFAYKNGVRTPVTCPTNRDDCPTALQCSYNKLIDVSLSSEESKKYVISQTESHNVQVPAISDQQLKMMSAYMTKEQLEATKKQMAEAAKQAEGQTYTTVKSMSVSFNGKTYGPFKQVTQLYLTQDRKNFYAVTMQDSENGMELRYKIITSATSTTLTTPGMMPPMQIFVAPDNSEFGMFLNDNDGKFKIITSAGKTFPIDNAGAFVGGWYSTTGNHLNYVIGNQLFHDSQLVKTFEGYSAPDPCNLFVSTDGKGVTVIKDNTISFADGDYFEYPIKTAQVNIGGKAYFKWMALEGKDVVVYQKPY